MFEGGEEASKEAMRFLPAGKHSLVLESHGNVRVHELIVRSIPEIIYYRVPGDPLVKQFGPYMGELLEKHILPNVNTLAGPREWRSPELETRMLRQWAQRGGKWLIHCGVPKGTKEKPVTADQARQYIAGTPGYSLDLVHGSIADEFGYSQPHCAAYAEAVRKLKATARFRERTFYPFAYQLYGGAEGRQLVQALVETDGAIAWKRYLKEQPDEETARLFLQAQLADLAREYARHCPGSIEHLIVCFGYFSSPPEFLNTDPQANYRVFLDMEFNLVANDPAFWGAFGLMTYTSPYADEETVRWGAQLFRHYGIEGRTDRASDEPYSLTHLQNPDFVDGTTGWDVQPAAQNSIHSARSPGFGWLQGRYPATREGDTVLVTVRNARRPNVFSQQIKNLEPGHLYSFRMFTGDFEDLSKREKHAVNIKLDGVTLIREKCFSTVFASDGSHHHPPYGGANTAWMNYHWRVFRAKGRSAVLKVSDWASENKPGGRIGQQLMVNHVSVQPYYADDDREPHR